MSKTTDTTKVKYRSASIEDIPQLMALENACFRTYYKAHRFSETQFRYYLTNPMAVTYVALVDEKIVGYILGLTQRGSRRHTARIYSLAVSPKMRKKGVGLRLMKLLIGSMRKTAANTVVLEVAQPNKPAIRLFAKMGFQQSKRMPDYYGPGYTGIRMDLLLTED